VACGNGAVSLVLLNTCGVCTCGVSGRIFLPFLFSYHCIIGRSRYSCARRAASSRRAGSFPNSALSGKRARRAIAQVATPTAGCCVAVTIRDYYSVLSIVQREEAAAVGRSPVLTRGFLSGWKAAYAAEAFEIAPNDEDVMIFFVGTLPVAERSNVKRSAHGLASQRQERAPVRGVGL
jgi:hypothetical protein